jgi:type I restriction enzyme S subunit
MAKVAVADVPGVDARLAAAFEVLAESPDGVARMRELVLSLAVRGQLVPQDRRDEPATELIARVAQARQAQASTVDSRVLVVPVLPSGWAWSTLGSLTPMPLTDGDWVESKDQDPSGCVRLVQLADVGVGVFKDKSDRWLNDATFSRLRCTELVKGDVLIARLPDPVGRACVFPGSVERCVTVVDVAIARAALGLVPEYLAAAINSPLVAAQVRAFGKGSTRFRVPTGGLKQVLVPVPPVQEQRRIVARVDELMAWIDQFEAARIQREAARIAARDACLATLCAATNPTEVAAAWSTLAARFDSLFSSAEEVALVRQSLRRLAITGRLVNQRVGDPPAADLLGSRCIAGEGAIPIGWAWSSLDRLGEQRGGGTPAKARADYWKGDVPWVSPKDMKRIDIVDSQDHISDAAIIDSPCKIIPTGSVLMVVRGMILAHSFPVAINRVPVTINQDMKALVPFEPSLAPYLRLALQGMRDEVLELVDRSTHGTCKLRTERLFSMPIALPPTEEQQRIMNRFDELMTICDKLQSALANAELLADELAAALVAVEA